MRCNLFAMLNYIMVLSNKWNSEDKEFSVRDTLGERRKCGGI
jgi:hypothetical protein